MSATGLESNRLGAHLYLREYGLPHSEQGGLNQAEGEINQVPYDMPGELKEAIRAFTEYYNYRRYHEGLGNVTPYDVYTGKQHEIIQRRKGVKSRTLEVRRDYNRTAREQGHGL